MGGPIGSCLSAIFLGETFPLPDVRRSVEIERASSHLDKALSLESAFKIEN